MLIYSYIERFHCVNNQVIAVKRWRPKNSQDVYLFIFADILIYWEITLCEKWGYCSKKIETDNFTGRSSLSFCWYTERFHFVNNKVIAVKKNIKFHRMFISLFLLIYWYTERLHCVNNQVIGVKRWRLKISRDVYLFIFADILRDFLMWTIRLLQ